MAIQKGEDEVKEFKETKEGTKSSSSSNSWYEKLKFLNIKKKEKKEVNHDLTTWSGYIKHLIQHIQKIDIPGMAANWPISFYYRYSPY